MEVTGLWVCQVQFHLSLSKWTGRLHSSASLAFRLGPYAWVCILVFGGSDVLTGYKTHEWLSQLSLPYYLCLGGLKSGMATSQNGRRLDLWIILWRKTTKESCQTALDCDVTDKYIFVLCTSWDFGTLPWLTQMVLNKNICTEYKSIANSIIVSLNVFVP